MKWQNDNYTGGANVVLSFGNSFTWREWTKSPNVRISAITDHSRGDFNVFESGAIMIYLCEHYDLEGKLLPKDPDLKSQAIQWVNILAR